VQAVTLVRIGLLAVAAMAIVLRAPALLSGDVGFWAEEGRVYFQYAWHHGAWAALWAPHQGYFALVPNLATVLATTVPLERAPIVTAGAAATVQLLTVALVVFSRAALLDSALRRTLGVALVLLIARTDEMWLNTINSQVYLSLAAALVLLEPTAGAGRARRLALRAVLLVAGLTGPSAASLVLLFAWVAWTSQERERWVQAGLLAVCAGVQASVMLGTGGSLGFRGRLGGLDVTTLAAIVGVRTIVFPVLGTDAAGDVIGMLGWAQRHGSATWLGVGIGALALEAAALTYLAVGAGPKSGRRSLAGAYVLLVLVGVLGATGSHPEKVVFLNPRFSPRYFYTPTVLVALLALDGVRFQPRAAGRVRAVVGGLLVVAALVVGPRFWTTLPPAGPHWPRQVAAWRSDPRLPLLIRPSGWEMRLSPRRPG
jgi:hypothetical protein